MKVELQDIRLSLGGQRLFDRLSHTFPAASKTLLYGPSGSGKSTLLRLLLGFVPPDSGRILIDGQPLGVDTVWALRKRTAYVPQGVHLGEGKVADFLEDLFSYQANKHLAPDREAINAYFQQFQLSENTLLKAISQLSGGERQRVAIIAALLLDRELYLLDEATAALDEALQEEVMQHFAGLEGKTVIAVAHQTAVPGFDALDIRTILSGDG